MINEDEFLRRVGETDTSKIETPEEKWKRLDKTVADLMDFDCDMSDYDYDFIYDMQIRVSKHQNITPNQEAYLDRLAGKYL